MTRSHRFLAFSSVVGAVALLAWASGTQVTLAAPGQSERIDSRHYKDQWGAYYGATSFPMQFDKVDAKDTLAVNPQ